MSLEINTLYRFAGSEADAVNRTVTCGGAPVPLPPRAFDLLLYMVRNPQRLLPKEELMNAVWSGLAVEESNLTQTVFLLRKALSASSTPENPIIVTVPGRGYRFGVEVESAAAAKVPAQPAAAVRRKRWYFPAAVLVVLAALAAALPTVVSRHSRVLSRAAIPMPKPLTLNAAENPVITAAISPDGRYLAYADPHSVTIRTLKSDETRSLPVETDTVPVKVAWFNDGTRLLISQRVNQAPRIMQFSILSGKLSLLRAGALSPAVSPDSDRILYADGSYSALWLMDASGENPRRVLSVPEPDRVYPMFWSPGGMRIWFVRVHWDKNVNTTTLETSDLNGAARTVALSDNRASAFRLLASGRLIYALVEDEAQKFTNLWELPVDADGGKPAGTPRKLTNWTGFSVSGLSSTADEKHLAMTNGTWQADVYVANVNRDGTQLAGARRLTLDQSDNWPAFWTPDDSAVVFESTRNGRSQIFRQRLDQTVPELLSTDSGEDQFPVLGGAWIYFFSLAKGTRLTADKPVAIRRIPAEGGASDEVMTGAGLSLNCAPKRPESCIVARLTGTTLVFYRFDRALGQGGEAARMRFDSSLRPDFALSPDGSEIAVIDPSGAGNRIRRIPLHGGGASAVEVPGRKGLENLFWAADGKGWFVSSLAPAGAFLLHVDARGGSSVLFEQPQEGRITWGVPSHDGSKLAFLRWTSSKNVWMIDDF